MPGKSQPVTEAAPETIASLYTDGAGRIEADKVNDRMRPSWGDAVTGFESYLRAANRSPQTIRLRIYWVTRFAKDCWGSGCSGTGR